MTHRPSGDRSWNRMIITPLSGIRVLELTGHLAGPSCARVLAHLGAEVLRIAPPVDVFASNSADAGRIDSSVPPRLAHGTMPALALDIVNPKQRDLILRLARECDVFVGALCKDAMNECGLGYEAVREVNRRVIYLSGAGDGRTGVDPGQYASRSSGGEPGTTCVSIGSSAAALQGAIAVLGALRHREVESGPGQAFDLAELEYALAAMSPGPVGSSSSRTVDDTASWPQREDVLDVVSGWLSLSMEQLKCLSDDGVI